MYCLADNISSSPDTVLTEMPNVFHVKILFIFFRYFSHAMDLTTAFLLFLHFVLEFYYFLWFDLLPWERPLKSAD